MIQNKYGDIKVPSDQKPTTDLAPSPEVKPENLPISIPLTPSEIESLRQEMKQAAEAMRKMRKYYPISFKANDTKSD